MDKLQGIKPGDRVRVTVHADVVMVNKGCVDLVLDGDKSITVGGWAHEASTFQIERIEPPLKVGDRVKSKHDTGTIVAVVNGWAWLRGDTTSPPYTTFLSDLERIA